jgi:hypothetical protein
VKENKRKVASSPETATSKQFEPDNYLQIFIQLESDFSTPVLDGLQLRDPFKNNYQTLKGQRGVLAGFNSFPNKTLCTYVHILSGCFCLIVR